MIDKVHHKIRYIIKTFKFIKNDRRYKNINDVVNSKLKKKQFLVHKKKIQMFCSNIIEKSNRSTFFTHQ